MFARYIIFSSVLFNNSNVSFENDINMLPAVFNKDIIT